MRPTLLKETARTCF